MTDQTDILHVDHHDKMGNNPPRGLGDDVVPIRDTSFITQIKIVGDDVFYRLSSDVKDWVSAETIVSATLPEDEEDSLEVTELKTRIAVLTSERESLFTHCKQKDLRIDLLKHDLECEVRVRQEKNVEISILKRDIEHTKSISDIYLTRLDALYDTHAHGASLPKGAPDWFIGGKARRVI